MAEVQFHRLFQCGMIMSIRVCVCVCVCVCAYIYIYIYMDGWMCVCWSLCVDGWPKNRITELSAVSLTGIRTPLTRPSVRINNGVHTTRWTAKPINRPCGLFHTNSQQPLLCVQTLFTKHHYWRIKKYIYIYIYIYKILYFYIYVFLVCQDPAVVYNNESWCWSSSTGCAESTDSFDFLSPSIPIRHCSW